MLRCVLGGLLHRRVLRRVHHRVRDGMHHAHVPRLQLLRLLLRPLDAKARQWRRCSVRPAAVRVVLRGATGDRCGARYARPRQDPPARVSATGSVRLGRDKRERGLSLPERNWDANASKYTHRAVN